ncbi:MAG TPA: nuclear transport factor 2 family protein [Trueperaceae bacterium]|nr:nuclear transport factor 2 family protein [Trueperaceae bacterium]
MTTIDEARRESMSRAVRAYFDACNAASPERFAAVLAEDCVHWFPPGTGGPYVGREAIVNLWLTFVRDKGSQWSIDRLVCDGRDLCIEWTHYKSLVGERIRGSEWYTFDQDGKIDGIWAHYASPRDADRAANELDGYPYAERGYHASAPALPAEVAAERRSFLAAAADSTTTLGGRA